MPTAVGARSLRCCAITAAEPDSDIRANPDRCRRQPDTNVVLLRMILEILGNCIIDLHPVRAQRGAHL